MQGYVEWNALIGTEQSMLRTEQKGAHSFREKLRQTFGANNSGDLNSGNCSNKNLLHVHTLVFHIELTILFMN